MGKAYLSEDQDGLLITDGVLSLRADFSSMRQRIRPGRLRSEILLRAAGIKGGRAMVPGDGGERPLRVADATAGLGEDALLLAAAGCEVLLFERDPVIAALLRDALRKAMLDEELQEAASRMTLHEADSIAELPLLKGSVDVVLLDPMFPERQKSGLVGKKFQLLHQIEQPCADEAALFAAAEASEPGRIAVKRPLKGPHLAGRRPDYALFGKAIRYDCYLYPEWKMR